MRPDGKQETKSVYGSQWDNYVRSWGDSPSGRLEWPGDEWGTPEVWERVFNRLFVPAEVASWKRAVEIGPGSGKYTLKVLESSSAEVRAYDISGRFLEVCEKRCRMQVEEGRLSLHLLSATQSNQILSDLDACGWRGKLDAFYSIDAMVHVDLQYMIVYLLTAALSLKPGGQLLLTLANVVNERGFRMLLEGASAYWHTQDPMAETPGKFEWLSADMVRYILKRLGFELTVMTSDRDRRDLFVVASLAHPETAAAFEPYLVGASRSNNSP
jgi:SAM-dependent methyltransferase